MALETSFELSRDHEEFRRVVRAFAESGWIGNAPKPVNTNSGSSMTSLVTWTARTGVRADGKPEISAIVVPSGTPGFTAEKPYDKLGWHASDTHPLSFEDVHVPAGNL